MWVQWEEVVVPFQRLPPQPLSCYSQLSPSGQFLHSLQSAHKFVSTCWNAQIQKGFLSGLMFSMFSFVLLTSFQRKSILLLLLFQVHLVSADLSHSKGSFWEIICRLGKNIWGSLTNHLHKYFRRILISLCYVLFLPHCQTTSCCHSQHYWSQNPDIQFGLWTIPALSDCKTNAKRKSK